MQTGRKILNLRRDRQISQQDLARACKVTPSALSKIEAGINSPRANIVWKLAKELGVTIEYLLDEDLPYPYSPYTYRQDLYAQAVNPHSTTRMEVTREEKAFLEALRNSKHVAREIAMAIPELSVETMRMILFLVHHSKITNPSRTFLDRFESLIKTSRDGQVELAAQPARRKSATQSRAGAPAQGRAGAPAKRKKTKARR